MAERAGTLETCGDLLKVFIISYGIFINIKVLRVSGAEWYRLSVEKRSPKRKEN